MTSLAMIIQYTVFLLKVRNKIDNYMLELCLIFIHHSSYAHILLPCRAHITSVD